MDIYRAALSQYLDPPERTQEALGAAIGKSQVAISRYVNGERFPDVDTARAIDAATDGAVPLSLWRADAAQRFGIADAPEQAAAA